MNSSYPPKHYHPVDLRHSGALCLLCGIKFIFKLHLHNFKFSSVYCDYNHPYTLKNAQNLYKILKIIHTHELSCMFQQKITVVRYNSKAYTTNTPQSHVQFY